MLQRLVCEQLEHSLHFAPKIFTNLTHNIAPLPTESIALVFLDTHIGNAANLLQAAASYISPMKTVILSNCDTAALLNHWRSCGYDCLVSMEATFAELLLGLQHADNEEAFHCPTIQDIIKNAKGGVLSVREQEVFDLLVKGSTNKNIATLLGVGEKSVHTYRKRLMGKLNCRSLADLILYAQQSQKLK